MWYGTPTTTFAEKYPSLYSYFDERVTTVRNRTSLQIYGMTIPERKAFFGDKNTYHKKGNTAICHFDNFALNDKAAWDNYYQGKGPRPTQATSPEDPMAIFLDALEQAAADPEVKNFVLDLSVNTGGSSDVVVAMTSLMYDQSLFRVYNVLTGQKTEWHYDVDRNFDGKYDAQDQDVHYDLNFCIITSPISFSCGNLYPSLCKDAGLLIAGQKSGGGSCAVGAHRTADGFYYQISAARARLSDANWQNINDGITPHVTLDYAKEMEYLYEEDGHNYTLYFYRNFWDLDNLSTIISEYYKNK
jgi:C-terminal processing protease CtpA/Prc